MYLGLLSGHEPLRADSFHFCYTKLDLLALLPPRHTQAMNKWVTAIQSVSHIYLNKILTQTDDNCFYAVHSCDVLDAIA